MPEPVVKSAQDAIEALRTVIAGREDFVYEPPGYTGGTCVNFALASDGDYQPSCVVGHVAALWGLEPEFWSRCATGSVNTLFDNLAIRGHWLRIEGDAMTVLTAAQMAQDDRHTWGYALARAESMYSSITAA